MRRSSAIPLFLVLTLAIAAPAIAQSSAGGSGLGWEGWGVRVGASSDPDQVYGGFHFDLGHFARDVRFRPTIELGIGDDVTLLQALAEAHYVFSKVQVWKPYVGGGVGLSWVEIDDAPPQVDDSDTDIALMGIGGVETSLKSGARFFMELKIGFGDDDPDFKVGLGWTWR
jgi:opacity protein-like surface antigen